jgi:hypothetical protein
MFVTGGSRSSRTVLAVAVAVSVPAILLGCPKKAPPAVEDAGGAMPPPANTPEVTELAALTDDGGADADAAGAVKRWTGGGGSNANQTKVKACCNAMRAQAKQIGNSPEAFQITALAAQCDAVAVQIGSQGNAPEFNQIRQMLRSIKLPAACQF